MTQALAEKRYWEYAEGSIPMPVLDSTVVFAADPAGVAAAARRRGISTRTSVSGRTTTALLGR